MNIISRKLLAVFAVVGLIFSSFFLFSLSASAATKDDINEVRFIDAARIQIDFSSGRSTIFRDLTGVDDDTFVYTANTSSHDCTGRVEFRDVSANDGIFNLEDFLEDRNNPETIDGEYFDLQMPLEDGSCDRFTGGEQDDQNDITITNAQLSTTPSPDPPPAGDDTGSENQDDASTGPTCESAGGVLGWILCPVIKTVNFALSFLDTQIEKLLNFDLNRLNASSPDTETTDQTGSIKQSWVVIRNVAYTILVPIMLVMVISTALGFEFISAYTVKKALPRLVVAVIFIALSWEITLLMINVTNALGAGIMGIMTFPFGEGVSNLSFGDLFGIPIAGDGVTGGDFLQGIVGFGGNIALGIGGILLIAFFWPSALAIMAIAFGVLMVRQIFIVALVLVAPLAILAWIFPGNDKLWKSWWSIFTKLLLMYPLIMGLLAVGRIFAFIINNSGSAGLEGAIINPIFKIIAYVAPYGFIPLTFKFAGGVFGTLTGAMNDRSKGFFDKQRQKRGAKRERWSSNRAVNANKYAVGSTRRKFADKLNNAASAATSNPWDTARIYGKTAGGKALLSEIQGDKHKQTHALSEALQKSGVTVDQAFRALSGTHSMVRRNARGEMIDKNGNVTTDRKAATYNALGGPLRTQQDIDRAIGILSQSSESNDRIAASQLGAARGFIANAYKSEEYGRGSMEGAALLGLASQGFAERSDIKTVTDSMVAAGDTQSAFTLGTDATYASYKGGRLDMKPTYGPQWGETLNDGKGGFSEFADFERQKELVNTLKGYEWTSAKGGAVKEMSEAFTAVAGERGADGEFTDNAVAARQVIAQNVNGSADPGAKAKWRALAREVSGLEGDALNDWVYKTSTGYTGGDPSTAAGQAQPPPDSPIIPGGK